MGAGNRLSRCHHVPRFGASLILAMLKGVRVETVWAVSRATECRVPFRPKFPPGGQSVPSGTILRGSVDVNRPTEAPEMA